MLRKRIISVSFTQYTRCSKLATIHDDVIVMFPKRIMSVSVPRYTIIFTNMIMHSKL